ncbi:MAG: DUF2225 domain-containing protein [Planctomycetes bacterium]|nr:DUF2225 domain-containing protein [Planctomycetota bacterium]
MRRAPLPVPLLRAPVAGVALLALFLLPATLLEAASVREKDAVCSFCAQPFQGLEIVAEDFAVGPPDPDLFVRPLNGAPREFFTVWTCPSCYYSALAVEFATPLTAEEKAAVAPQIKELKWLRPEGMAEKPESQIRIPGWFKHKAMYLCAKARGVPSFVLGNILLRGAWTARVTHDTMDRDPKLAQMYKEIAANFVARHAADLAPKPAAGNGAGVAPDSGAHDLVPEQGFAVYRLLLTHGRLVLKDLEKGEFTEEEKPVAWFMAGYFLREGGEHREAIGALSQVKSFAKTPARLQEMASSELYLQKVEQEFQEQALAHFAAALEKKEVEDLERTTACTYLIGELNRRLGNAAEAARNFDVVLQDARLTAGEAAKNRTLRAYLSWAKAQRALVAGK